MAVAQKKTRLPTRSEKIDQTKPASIIINERFNGLTDFCTKTGFPLSTVHWWLTKGFIPPKRQLFVQKVAADHKIKLKPTDFVEQQIGG